ncbi:MAG: hypothetical protein Q8K77_06055, partial [Thermodesulfovibrionales bacterium]|nr:hypothetical protein [Thermodesulfovibrionales bacterium]
NNKELLNEVKVSLHFLSDSPFSATVIEEIFKAITERRGIKLGALAQPVRVAITGGTESPGIFEVLEVLGKNKTIKRLEKAIKSILNIKPH